MALGDPLVVTERNGVSRTRVVVGVCVAVVGAYLAFDPRGRIEAIGPFVGYWWVICGGLAIVLLLQLIPNVASRVLVCAFGGVALVGIFGLPDVDTTILVGLAPALMGVAGAMLAVTAVRKRVDWYVAVLWFRRVHAPRDDLPALTRLICVAGGLRVDLTSASLTQGQRLRISMVGADVAVVIPREWRCRVTGAHVVGVWVRERGRIPATGPVLDLEIAAFGGLLTVVRD